MSVLPSEKSKPKRSLDGASVLLYGQRKIGKTTMASSIPGALLVATEPGYDYVSVHPFRVKSWDDWVECKKALFKEKHSFRCVVIDTLEEFYRHIQDHVIRTHGGDPTSVDPDVVSSINQGPLGYGHGSSRANMLLHTQLLGLKDAGYSVWLLSHCGEREVEEGGVSQVMMYPRVPNRAFEVVDAFCDFIFFATVEERPGQDGRVSLERVIRYKNSPRYVAGSRWLPEGSPDSIPLDYKKIKEVFNAK